MSYIPQSCLWMFYKAKQNASLQNENKNLRAEIENWEYVPNKFPNLKEVEANREAQNSV